MHHTLPVINLISFADSHLPLFRQWLFAEHVAPWFEHPQSWLEELRGRRQQYQWIHHYIITSYSPMPKIRNPERRFCQQALHTMKKMTYI